MFERWYELTVKTWEKATRTPLRTPLIFKRPQTMNLNHYKEQHISGDQGQGKLSLTSSQPAIILAVRL